MKIRNILFGYCYEDGRIVLSVREAETVKEIFNSYRDGKSLLQLSQELNAGQVEYMSGVIGWNKSRIMRLLEDERYTGEKGYPKIIDRELFDEIQVLKSEKCEQKDLDRKADIFQMHVPVRCPKCNNRMRRIVDNRVKNPIRWSCRTVGCGFSKNKKDKDLFEELTALLNKIIENPETIEVPMEQQTESGIELRRLNSEISQAFNAKQIDGEAVRKKMLMYATLKYAEVDSAVGKAQRIKDIFVSTAPLKEFSLTLLEKTVDEIKLYEDGTIGILLENGQEIGKEVAYASNCS